MSYTYEKNINVATFIVEKKNSLKSHFKSHNDSRLFTTQSFSFHFHEVIFKKKRFFPRIKNLLFITCWSKKRWLSTRNHFSSVLTESFNRKKRKEKKRGLCIRGLKLWWRVGGVGRRWESRKLMMPEKNLYKKKKEGGEEEHGNMNCVADNHKLLSFIIRNIFFCSSTNVKFSSSPILLSHSIGNCVKNLTAYAKTWMRKTRRSIKFAEGKFKQ